MVSPGTFTLRMETPPTPVEDFEWMSISSQESVTAESGLPSKSHRREREPAAAGVFGDVLPSVVGAVGPTAPPRVVATTLPAGLATPVRTVTATANMATPGVVDGSTSAPGTAVPDCLDEFASRFPDVVGARSKLSSILEMMRSNINSDGKVNPDALTEAGDQVVAIAFRSATFEAAHGADVLKEARVIVALLAAEAVKLPPRVFTIFDSDLTGHGVDPEAVRDWNVSSLSGASSLRIRVLGAPSVLSAMETRQVALRRSPLLSDRSAVGARDDSPQFLSIHDPGFTSSETLVLHGESGSGKTISALSLAASDDRACVYVVHEEWGELNFAKGDRTARDAQAFQLVVDELNNIFKYTGFGKKKLLSVPKQGDAKVIIVIDELGGYPDFVRALIRKREAIVAHVAQLFLCRTACLVLCGTGIETSTHSPGSLPHLYKLHSPTPRATWDGIHAYFSTMTRSTWPSRLAAAVQKRGSLQARVAHELVSNNARIAALFIRHVQALRASEGHLADSDSCLDAVIDSCSRRAAVDFKNLNGMKALTRHQHFACVAAAVRAVRTGCLPAEFRYKLCVRYGLLTDHLLREGDDKTFFYALPPDCLGQRYAMSRAQYSSRNSWPTFRSVRRQARASHKRSVITFYGFWRALTAPVPKSALLADRVEVVQAEGTAGPRRVDRDGRSCGGHLGSAWRLTRCRLPPVQVRNRAAAGPCRRGTSYRWRD
jgi:hypothetical protein